MWHSSAWLSNFVIPSPQSKNQKFFGHFKDYNVYQITIGRTNTIYSWENLHRNTKKDTHSNKQQKISWALVGTLG